MATQTATSTTTTTTDTGPKVFVTFVYDKPRAKPTSTHRVPHTRAPTALSRAKRRRVMPLIPTSPGSTARTTTTKRPATTAGPPRRATRLLGPLHTGMSGQRPAGEQPGPDQTPDVVADHVAHGGGRHHDDDHEDDIGVVLTGDHATDDGGDLTGNEEPDHDGHLEEDQQADHHVDNRAVQMQEPALDAGDHDLCARGAAGAQRDHDVHDALTHVRRRHAGQVMNLVYPRPGRQNHRGTWRTTNSTRSTCERTRHEEQCNVSDPNIPELSGRSRSSGVPTPRWAAV